MRLDVFMSETGLAKSRTHAKNLVALGKVSINGRLAEKPSEEVRYSDTVEVDRLDDFSSLGGLKLKHALDEFGLDPAGKVCIDIGSSNGGFTDVMLRAGAKKVYCVDIGECALPEEMTSDTRVEVRDRLNARYLAFEDIGVKADMITVDVSFISLKLVLPALVQFMKNDTSLVALIKPQFEVGRKFLTKTGIVRQERAAYGAVDGVTAFASGLGLKAVGTVKAPHPFKEKNTEFLTLFRLVAGAE